MGQKEDPQVEVGWWNEDWQEFTVEKLRLIFKQHKIGTICDAEPQILFDSLHENGPLPRKYPKQLNEVLLGAPYQGKSTSVTTFNSSYHGQGVFHRTETANNKNQLQYPTTVRPEWDHLLYLHYVDTRGFVDEKGLDWNVGILTGKVSPKDVFVRNGESSVPKSECVEECPKGRFHVAKIFLAVNAPEELADLYMKLKAAVAAEGIPALLIVTKDDIKEPPHPVIQAVIDSFDEDNVCRLENYLPGTNKTNNHISKQALIILLKAVLLAEKRGLKILKPSLKTRSKGHLLNGKRRVSNIVSSTLSGVRSYLSTVPIPVWVFIFVLMFAVICLCYGVRFEYVYI